MSVGYVLTRVAMLFLVIWIAASVVFIIPRLARVLPQSAVTRARHGLDRPIIEQYGSYLWETARFDFGPSVTYFPSQVGRHIQMRLPWTVGLLTISTALTFVVGNILGAVLGWPGSSPRARWLVPILMPFMAMPYYLLGLILIFLLAFTWPILPSGGGYSTATTIELTPRFALDVLRHGALPALSIVLSSIGFWIITMRSLMITNLDEDYVVMAEAKGLSSTRILFRYAMRNSALPQVTMLAITFGQIVSGALLVEIIFDYPGMGWILREAIGHNDYRLIQGIVFVLILSVATATLVFDLVAPLVDRRIVYERS
jgi:peptide/nickel transport system permease protein